MPSVYHFLSSSKCEYDCVLVFVLAGCVSKG